MREMFLYLLFFDIMTLMKPGFDGYRMGHLIEEAVFNLVAVMPEDSGIDWQVAVNRLKQWVKCGARLNSLCKDFGVGISSPSQFGPGRNRRKVAARRICRRDSLLPPRSL